MLDVDRDDERAASEELDLTVLTDVKVLAADVEGALFPPQTFSSLDCLRDHGALEEEHPLVHTSCALSLPVDFDRLQMQLKVADPGECVFNRLPLDRHEVHTHTRSRDNREDAHDWLELQDETPVVCFAETAETLALLATRVFFQVALEDLQHTIKQQPSHTHLSPVSSDHRVRDRSHMRSTET